jgi:hypothetical protein
MSVWLPINCEGVKGREIEYGCKTVFGFARHYKWRVVNKVRCMHAHVIGNKSKRRE